MTIFKCKMCGGTLEVNEGDSVVECEYCGTKQTLPKLDNDRKINLYDRANHYRRNNEFDKAMSIYEQILDEDNTDAEAYWSIVLCRYGVEYVEDPSTHKRIPTVNRTQFTSIKTDEDYKAAINHADILQKTIYKETDNVGNRTVDSVLAYDLYNELTKEGYKVFFSRITLEDKIGTAYEPYIFAALNSAKIMIVLGTKPEYFNATWVKNEWSRYLTLVKKSNGKKILIPAYKDMDPYDLPEEFSYLQAQDMSKLGFMQDLLRGIKKILVEETKETSTKKTNESKDKDSAIPAVSKTDPLLERAFMFLEDEEWGKAEKYCEKVLDKNPKCAKAYLGKAMAELQIRYLEELEYYNDEDLDRGIFDRNDNLEKAIRYADDELRQQLEKYRELNEEKIIENKRKVKEFEKEDEFYCMGRTYSECQKLAEEYEKKDEEIYKKIAKDFYEKTAENIKKRKKFENFIPLRNKVKKAEMQIQELNKKIDNLKVLKNDWNFIETNIKNYEHNINSYTEEISNLTAQKSSLGFLAIRKKQEIDGKIMMLQNQMKSEKKLLLPLQAQKQNYNSLEDVHEELENCQMLISENQRFVADNDKKYHIDLDDEIVFGEFECFPIVWKVVSNKENRLSLFCERSLCRMSFDEFGNEDYEKSSLRKWLNTEFYNNAFSETEKTIIEKSNRQITQKIYEEETGYKDIKKEIQDYVSLIFGRSACNMYGQESIHCENYKEYFEKRHKRFFELRNHYIYPEYRDAFWVFPTGDENNYNCMLEYDETFYSDDTSEKASVHPFIEITL